ncbi:MAG TPA: LytTR family DNA-binding domain-containing protein [Chitinophagales bacterium]|nr:LytTR family DNA-binding domain-containing protein [Chitinophagales bacterium]
MKPILSYPSPQPEETLLLSTNDGWFYVPLSHIVHCSSESSYTEFHMVDGQVLVVSCTLLYYEKLISAFGFFRIHKSHLINTKYLRSVTRQDATWYVGLSNGSSLPVSRERKGGLIDHLQMNSVAGLNPYSKKMADLGMMETKGALEVKLKVNTMPGNSNEKGEDDKAGIEAGENTFTIAGNGKGTTLNVS